MPQRCSVRARVGVRVETYVAINLVYRRIELARTVFAAPEPLQQLAHGGQLARE